MNNKLPRVGMRNIKTALAVTITILLSRLFKMEYPFYAAIAVVITMQASVTASYKVGKERMLGTAVGALVGLICALISPGTALLCGFGIIIIIYTCNYFKWNKSISIAGIVFLAIMVNLGDRNPLSYSINRLLDTFLGIIIALLVNYFICPPNHKDKMYRNYNTLFDNMFSITKDKFCNNQNIDLSVFYLNIKNFDESINTYISESKIKHKENIEIDKLNNTLEISKDISIHFKILQCIEGPYKLTEDNISFLNKLFNINLEASSFSEASSLSAEISDGCTEANSLNKENNNLMSNCNNNDNLSIIYNYHVNEILKKLMLLKK